MGVGGEAHNRGRAMRTKKEIKSWISQSIQGREKELLNRIYNSVGTHTKENRMATQLSGVWAKKFQKSNPGKVEKDEGECFTLSLRKIKEEKRKVARL